MRKVATLSVLLATVSVAPTSADVVQGFVYTAGRATFIDLPGFPTGINDAGQIVGWGREGGFPLPLQDRGFLYDAGTVTTLAPPGTVSSSYAFDINDAGQILGSFFSQDASGFHYQGFLYDAGTYTTIDIPGVSPPSGINDAGQMVGAFNEGSTVHGYLYDAGTLTTIDMPGVMDSWASDINDVGQIVGGFRNASLRNHGWLRDANGSFTTIDVPGSDQTDITDINDAGQIVGVYFAGGAPHGFLYSGGSFSTIDLSGGATYAQGINDTGQIVGAIAGGPLPEPGSMLLFGSGLVGVWTAVRNRRASSKSK
jgi:probable HAF family extracellular repeat protein